MTLSFYITIIDGQNIEKYKSILEQKSALMNPKTKFYLSRHLRSVLVHQRNFKIDSTPSPPWWMTSSALVTYENDPSSCCVIFRGWCWRHGTGCREFWWATPPSRNWDLEGWATAGKSGPPPTPSGSFQEFQGCDKRMCGGGLCLWCNIPSRGRVPSIRKFAEASSWGATGEEFEKFVSSDRECQTAVNWTEIKVKYKKATVLLVAAQFSCFQNFVRTKRQMYVSPMHNKENYFQITAGYHFSWRSLLHIYIYTG